MDKKRHLLFLMGDILVLIIVLGIAYATFLYVKPGTKVNKIVSGSITMEYTESSNKIGIANATPMTDASGEAMDGEGEYFDFVVSTKMNINYAVSYEVTAKKDQESTLEDSDIRLYLEKYKSESEIASGETIDYEAVFTPKAYTPINANDPSGTDELGAGNDEMLLDSGEISSSEYVYYRLRMWIAEGYTFTAGSKTYEVSVNVYGKDVEVNGVTNLTLDKSTLTVQKGETKQLTATIKPDNAKNRNLIWTSSNTDVARVDSAGNITGVGTGTATITVKTSDKSLTATCTVTVVDADATSVSLNTNSMTLVKGNSETLTATVLPNDAADKTVTWSSSSNGIATVSSSGKVVAVGIGEADITVETVNGKTATCHVTVTAPNVESITLTGSDTVDVGSTIQLTTTVSSDSLENSNIVYTSSDETKATVSSTGKVTGVGAGSVTITATVKEYPEKFATKSITVQKPEIESITMNSNMSITQGNSTIFMIALTPADVRNKSSITWESSNSSVASIPASCAGQTYCEITGSSVGSTTITAKTTSSIYDTSTLTVTAPVQGIVIDNKKDSIRAGENYQLHIYTYPSGTNLGTITWTSSNTSVATVSSTGLVNGISGGTTTITATTSNNKTDSFTLTVEEDKPLSTFLASKYGSDSTMIKDSANNIRYTGASPNNYITFNGEDWRIIGIFGDNVKIVRNTRIGAYSWDNKHGYYGYNEWNGSSLKTTLNTAYYNSQNTTCYSGATINATAACDFSSTGLKADARKMIQNYTWNLGGAAWDSSSTGGFDKTAAQWYSLERGTTVVSGRSTSDTFKVGLIYPSDYGYASSNCYQSTYLRASSGSTDYRQDTCKNSNWLLSILTNNGSSISWSLSPGSDYENNVWRVTADGSVVTYSALVDHGVSPAVYLKSSVNIADETKTGSSSSKYTIVCDDCVED